MEWRNLLKFGEWPAFYKILLGVLAILVVSLGTLTYLYISVLPRRFRSRIGAQIGDLAISELDQVAGVIAEQMTVLETLTLNEAFVTACTAANAQYGEDVDEQLRALEMAWREAGEDGGPVQALLDPQLNALSAQLYDHQASLPYVTSFLVTDQYGAALAATEQPDRYVHAEALWWQSAYGAGAGGVYVGPSEDDAASPYDALILALPIVSQEDGVVLGVIRMAFRPSVFSQSLLGSWVDSYNIWSITLVDDQGRAIAAARRSVPGGTVDPSWLGDQYLRSRSRHYHQAVNAEGQDVLLGHASFRYLDLADDVAFLESLPWVLFVSQLTRDAYQPVQATSGAAFGLGLLFLLLGGGGALLLARVVAMPLSHLVESAHRIGSGDYAARIWEYPTGEYKYISQVFNALLEERGEMSNAIEQSANVRAREQARRERDLEVAAAVGNAVALASDTQSLSDQVVDLIREGFGLYYVGLYLLDDRRQWAVLYAGTGEPGEAMLARGHRIDFGAGLVGAVVASGEARVIADIDEELKAQIPPELPYSRAIVVLPLRSRGQTLGAISVHSYHVEAFDEESVIVLQTIADQVSVAIDSIRLFAERQQATQRLQDAYGEITQEVWVELLRGGSDVGMGYESELTGLSRLRPTPPEAWREEARQAWESGALVEGAPEASGQSTLALPIKVRDEIIGVIDVSKRSEGGAWTQEELLQLQDLVAQLSVTLESARLYEMTRRSAAGEQLVSEITNNIRALLDVDAILRTSVEEVRERLGLVETEVWLGTDADAAVEDV